MKKDIFKDNKIQIIEWYLDGLGNHKLEMINPNKFYIIRKSKNYSFKLDFSKLYDNNCTPEYIGSHNGKDYISVIFNG